MTGPQRARPEVSSPEHPGGTLREQEEFEGLGAAACGCPGLEEPGPSSSVTSGKIKY